MKTCLGFPKLDLAHRAFNFLGFDTTGAVLFLEAQDCCQGMPPYTREPEFACPLPRAVLVFLGLWLPGHLLQHVLSSISLQWQRQRQGRQHPSLCDLGKGSSQLEKNHPAG